MTAPPLPTFVPQDAWYKLTTGGVNPSVADPVPNATYLAPSSTPLGLVDGLVGPGDGFVVFLAGLASENDGGQKWLMWEAASLQTADNVNVFNPWAVATTPGRWVTTGQQQNSGPGAVVSVQQIAQGATAAVAAASTPQVMVFVVAGVAAPTSIALPGSTSLGQTVSVKDTTGNAGTNNITVTAPSIDGAASYVLVANYQQVAFTWNGNSWSVT